MRRLPFALWTLFFLLSSQVLQARTEAFSLRQVLVPADEVAEITLSPLSSLLAFSRGRLVYLDLKHRQLLFFNKDASNDRAVPLPDGMEAVSGSLWTLLTAPKGDVWVIAHGKQQLWCLFDGKWSGPTSMGQELGPAIMLRDGRILASTPESSTAAFEIFDPATPQNSQAFGRRIPPVHPLLEREDNTWVLGNAPDHHIVAFHAYRPLVRIYSTDPPSLVLEKTLEGPEVALMETRRKAAVEQALKRMNTRCSTCLKIDLVNFADHLSQMGRGVIFHLGGQYQAQPLSITGVQGDPILLDLSLHRPMTGFCLHGQMLAAIDSRGVVLLRAMDKVPQMEGIVLSESGEAIDGATVSFSGLNQTSYRTKTDPLGAFLLRGIHLDQMGKLRIEAKGYFPLERSGKRMVLTGTPLILKPVPRVCLAVKNDRGEAVEKYSLSVYRSEDTSTSISHEPGATREINDPDGIGCIQSSWTKNFSITIEADGYAIHEEKFVSAEDREIRLHPEGRLHVIVLGGEEARQPVPDADIMLTAPSEERRNVQSSLPGGFGRTDQGGSVELVGLQPGSMRLQVSQADFLSSEEEIELFEGDNERTIVLQKGATIHCYTRKGKGDAVEKASVQLQGVGRALSRMMSCTTDETGECEISAVPPGTYKAVASKPGIGSCRERVSVEPGREKVDVILNLSGDHSLVGQVTGLEKYPTLSFEALVNVSGQTRRAPVGSDGGFRLDGLRAGDAWVSLRDLESRSSYAFQDVEIGEEEELSSIEIELEDPLRVRGHVLVGQRDCVNCRVDFRSRGAAITPVSRNVSTNNDGAYQVQLPCRGSFLVSALDPETHAASKEIVELRSDRELDFHLGRGSIRGVTIDRDTGDSLDGVLIQVFEDGQALTEIRSQGGGVFKIQGLPAGNYSLIGSSENGSGHKEVELGSDETADIRLEIEEKGNIRLQLRDPSGSYLGFAHFRLRSADGLVAVVPGVLGGPDHVFSVHALSGQPHQVTVAPPGLARVVLDNVSPGPPLDVVVPFPASLRVEVHGIQGCSLEVRDGSGRALALNLSSEPGPIPIQSSGALLTGLPPGSATVVLKGCDGAVWTESVQLVSDNTAVAVFQGE
ncbi:MAG: carboxypeptidase regulatory-like domain-containing protein [Thermoanaerobaculales bacterium]|nr:carboxypeptidase regulatory-like domain-containing protein [Thermoanaerobaculales bacterium]